MAAESLATVSEAESVVSSVDQELVWAEARDAIRGVSGSEPKAVPASCAEDFRPGPTIVRTRVGPVLVEASGTAAGSPVLMLPAFGGGPTECPAWKAAFEDAGHRVFIVGWPGSRSAPGESGRARAASALSGPSNPVDMIIDLVKELGDDEEQVHVFGHDFGAAVGFGAVQKQPELFASLTAFHPPSTSTGGAMSCAALARVTVPTHLVWVKSDQFHPLKTGRAAFSALTGLDPASRRMTVIDSGIFRSKTVYRCYAALGTRLTDPAVAFVHEHDKGGRPHHPTAAEPASSASAAASAPTAAAEATAEAGVPSASVSHAQSPVAATQSEASVGVSAPDLPGTTRRRVRASPHHSQEASRGATPHVRPIRRRASRQEAPARAKSSSATRHRSKSSSSSLSLSSVSRRFHHASSLPVALPAAAGRRGRERGSGGAENRTVARPLFHADLDYGSTAWSRSVDRMCAAAGGSHTTGSGQASSYARPRKQQLDKSQSRGGRVEEDMTKLLDRSSDWRGYPPETGDRGPGKSRTVFVTPPPPGHTDSYDFIGPSEAKGGYISVVPGSVSRRAFRPARGSLFKWAMPWGRSVRGILAGPWFRGTGDDEAGVRAPVLIDVHGWGRNSQGRNQQHLWARMADAGWRVLVIDQPGFGHTPGLRHSCRSEHNFSERGPVRVILSVLTQLGVISADPHAEPCVKAAAAAGKAARKQAPIHAPDLVKALAAVDLSASASSSSASSRARAASAPRAGPTSAATGAGEDASGFTYTSFRRVRSSLLPVAAGTPFMMMGSSWGGGIVCSLTEVPAIRRRLTHIILIGASYTDHAGVLSRIRAATLIIWVKTDAIHPIGLGRSMFERIPGAEMVEGATTVDSGRYGNHSFEALGPQWRAPVWEWLQRQGLPFPAGADP